MTSETGGKTATQIDAEWRQWSQMQPSAGGCIFCPDFRPTGTMEEVRLEHREHLENVHPELLSRRRRKRGRSNPAVLSFRQNLTDEESKEIDDERVKRMKLLGIS